MLAISNDNFRWTLSLNPTIAGTFTYSDVDNSAVQVATGATANTISNLGVEIVGGYAASNIAIEKEIKSILGLGSTIDGTPDELVLSVMPLSSNADIHGSLSWTELL
jgi:hypothetical protein